MLIGYFIWRTNSRSLLALSLAWRVGSKTLHHQTPSLHPNFFMGILKLLRQSSYSSRLWEHIGTFYEQSKFTVLTAAPLHSMCGSPACYDWKFWDYRVWGEFALMISHGVWLQGLRVPLFRGVVHCRGFFSQAEDSTNPLCGSCACMVDMPRLCAYSAWFSPWQRQGKAVIITANMLLLTLCRH